MSDLSPTYTFDGDQVYAIFEGKVIASGESDNMPKVESDAVKYLEGLTVTRDADKKEKAKKDATHIITPNGVRGEIIGRTASIYGEEVTARFDNGQFGSFVIHAEDNVQWVNEKTASAESPIARLSSVLDEEYDKDKQSLVARHDQLLVAAQEAEALLTRGAAYNIEVELSQIHVAALHEAREIKEAYDHLEAADYESFIPDAPFEPHVVEQADLGRSKGDSWLDVTTQQIIDETENQDFGQLLNEGPSLFVTDLDTGALADAGVTREMALSHVVAKTAGFTGKEVEQYREEFIARTEAARREELATRKETMHREAAATQEVNDNAPDEALYL